MRWAASTFWLKERLCWMLSGQVRVQRLWLVHWRVLERGSFWKHSIQWKDPSWSSQKRKITYSPRISKSNSWSKLSWHLNFFFSLAEIKMYEICQEYLEEIKKLSLMENAFNVHYLRQYERMKKNWNGLILRTGMNLWESLSWNSINICFRNSQFYSNLSNIWTRWK